MGILGSVYASTLIADVQARIGRVVTVVGQLKADVQGALTSISMGLNAVQGDDRSHALKGERMKGSEVGE